MEEQDADCTDLGSSIHQPMENLKPSLEQLTKENLNVQVETALSLQFILIRQQLKLQLSHSHKWLTKTVKILNGMVWQLKQVFWGIVSLRTILRYTIMMILCTSLSQIMEHPKILRNQFSLRQISSGKPTTQKSSRNMETSLADSLQLMAQRSSILRQGWKCTL